VRDRDPELESQSVDPVAIEDSQLQHLAPALLPYQQPPETYSPPPSVTQIQNQSTKRRSFLEALLARQQRKGPGGVNIRDNRNPTQRILNPINLTPRPVLVNIDHNQQVLPGGQGGQGEVHTLLTLPEQRRSRQYSNSPDEHVEHSPQLSSGGASRTSIGLPRNQRRTSQLGSTTSLPQMVDSEKPPSSGIQEPEKAAVPTSRYNTRDVEQQGASILGSNYGLNPLDQPLHPPRRVASHRSLKHFQSSNSLRSSQYQPNAQRPADGVAPPLPPGGGPIGSPNNAGDDEDGLAEELAWGPSHPCFPHLNPHVPKSSLEFQTTRVIRIRRDWMVVGDLAPTFSNIYPEILDPLVTEQEFRYIIQHINATLVHAFDPFASSNWLDGVLGFMTGWFWEDLRGGGVKGKLKELEAWTEEWNRTVGMREGVRIIPLRRTGYMNLDIVIPDPQVRVVGDDEQGEERQGTGYGSAAGTVE
jgi:hypothetical protein